MRKIRATVTPNSRKGPLVQALPDGSIHLYVRAPATEGKANKAACELLAKYFAVSKTAVELTGGATARYKRFTIHD